MKKTLLTLLIALSGAAIFAQSCVPDPNVVDAPGKQSDGNYPATLATAYVGHNYTMVITHVVPLDTSVTVVVPVPVVIDSVDITSVKGLPLGFTYSSNPISGHFKGGTEGCTVISGITNDPTLVGVHPLTIYTKAYAKIQGQSTEQPANIDSVKTYSLTIQLATGLNSFSMTDAGSLLVYPNPASGVLNVSAVLNETSLAALRVFNTLGELVLVENVALTNNSLNRTIDLSGSKPGIYFLEINSQKGIIRQKVMIR